MANHSVEYLFEKFKYRSVIVLSCAILTIIFLLSGGWSSIRDSIANVKWLKSVASHGPDLQLLYPLGVCGEVTSVTQKVEGDVPTPASPYLAGLAALRIGDLVTAEQRLQQAMSEGISINSTPNALGVVYYLQGKDPVGLWQQNNEISRLLKIGWDCELSGNLEIATIYFRFVLNNLKPKIDYSNREIYQQLVDFFAGTKDEVSFNLSLQSYLYLAEPNSLEYYWTIGNAWRDHGQPARALEYYQIILERTPDDPTAWFNAGQMLVELDEPDKARPYLKKANELNPKNPGYFVAVGDTYLYVKEYDEASIWYEQAIAIDPNNIWGLTDLTHVRMAQKRYDEALILISRVIMLDPTPSVYALATEVAINKKDWQLAREYITEALNRNPDSLNYYYKLANICEAISDFTCMEQSYMQLLRLDPNDEKTKNKLNDITGRQP